jgi:hypothetical protein
MLELQTDRMARDILADCARRGLVIKLDTIERKRMARHWHLGFAKQPGVLEVTDLGDGVLLKVASNRDGGWARSLARELARPKKRTRPT